MRKCKRELYYKKIGELTQKEFEQLFNIMTDISQPSFREQFRLLAEQSIANINVLDYNKDDMNAVTAYLLGAISVKQLEIPKNHLIVLFGEPSSGKSHLIHLISELKQRDMTEITEEDRKIFGFSPKDYTSDGEIRELKEMVDSISVIQKKATRLPRDGETYNPEIQAGITREEVQKCEWTYEFSGNLYGIEKKKIDEALEVGNAITIVNDASMKVINKLKETYPENFVLVMVYKDIDKEKWISDMRKAGRTEKEIGERVDSFWSSRKIYSQSHLPDVIFNMSER